MPLKRPGSAGFVNGPQAIVAMENAGWSVPVTQFPVPQAPPRRWSSPTLLLGLACLVLLGLLLLPMTLPIGPFYWDLFIYFDAANRIVAGQVPAVDFFAPVGPLGYWLFTGLVTLFPAGQPLLVAQWSLMLVTAPLFALVLVDVDRQSRVTALSLLVPFLVFSVLPFNVEQYYAYPGVDGFGIYNRQVSQLLYVLASSLVFVRSDKIILATIAGTVLALFLVKITGFIAAVGLCAFAFAAGRVALRTAVLAALLFVTVLGGAEASLGLVSAYLADILQLLQKNEGSLLPRFLQAASIHFDVFAPLVILTVALAWFDRRAAMASGAALVRRPCRAALQSLLDRDLFWLGLATMAGLFVETQNTGGQAFIFVWPVLLAILHASPPWQGPRLVLVLTLVAAASLPTFLNVVQRGARSLVGQARYQVLPSAHLGTLGAVSQRPEILQRATTMRDAYRQYPEAWQFLTDRGETPSFMLYTEPDFQLTWLMSVDEAVGAIEAYEAAEGVHFGSIMSLSFVNPFPWLLHRQAPRHIAIGADPSRSVPDPDEAVLGAVAGTDLALLPLCPVTPANEALLKLYAPALQGHRRIRLSPCWDAFVKASPVSSSAP
jgi:hypothetical protein